MFSTIFILLNKSRDWAAVCCLGQSGYSRAILKVLESISSLEKRSTCDVVSAKTWTISQNHPTFGLLLIKKKTEINAREIIVRLWTGFGTCFWSRAIFDSWKNDNLRLYDWQCRRRCSRRWRACRWWERVIILSRFRTVRVAILDTEVSFVGFIDTNFFWHFFKFTFFFTNIYHKFVYYQLFKFTLIYFLWLRSVGVIVSDWSMKSCSLGILKARWKEQVNSKLIWERIDSYKYFFFILVANTNNQERSNSGTSSSVER